MRLEAIVRNFEIIGEAASKVPQEVREKYPFISWRKISDFRNVLAHEYFGIDYEIMWEIIKDKLPPQGMVTREPLITAVYALNSTCSLRVF